MQVQQHIYLEDYRRYSVVVELPHAGLYNYNGTQIELFHIKWFNGGKINRT